MRDYIIADNQDITRAGLLYLLNGFKDSGKVAEVSDKRELISSLKQTPDAVVVIDYTLFDFSGADELFVLHQRFPVAGWILFSDELSEEFLRRMLFSAMSFSVVMKDSTKEEILSAFQCVSHGSRFICNHVGNLLLNSRSQTAVQEIVLTPTEQEILKEMALGKTTKEIASARFLSFHTVNTHRKNIFRKLGINNIHEATKYAMRAGIIDLAEYYI